MKKRLTLWLVAALLVAASFGSAAAAVRSEVLTHQSAALGREQKFQIFYPQLFNPNRKYPVLYLLHGAGGSYNQWASRGTLGEILERYEMFVVLPDGDKTSWYVDSPTTDSKYESYIIRDLIPYIDRKFPTVSDRKYRAISGLSMGGHGAITLAIKHPDLFASASSLSGIMDIVRHPNEWGIAARLGSRDENLSLWKANCALNLLESWQGNPPVALFTSCGVDDFALQENRDFAHKMEELKIPHLYVEHPGAHTMDYWLGHIEEHLLFHNYYFRKQDTLVVPAGESISFYLPINVQKEGKISADLPAGWQLAEAAFPAESNMVQLKLRVAADAPSKIYFLPFYPVCGGEKLPAITQKIQVSEPLAVRVRPAWRGEWQLNINVENLTRTQTLSGQLKLNQPLQSAVAISGLAPGESRSFSVPAGNVVAGQVYPLEVLTTLASGYEKKLSGPVSFLGAAKVSEQPSFDGDLSKWAALTPGFKLDTKAQVKNIPDWKGIQDLSGVGYLLWDEKNLYLAVQVQDDVHFQTGSGDDIWAGDSVQFAIDPSAAAGSGDGWHEYGFALSGSTLGWRWLAADGRPTGSMIGRAQVAISRHDQKTSYQIALPWEEIVESGAEIEPGLTLGFSLLINDNDGQGRGWIEYMGGIGASKDPNAFGELVLVD